MDRRAMIKVGLRLYGLPAFEALSRLPEGKERDTWRLPEGKEEILGIFDLHGFSLKNSDLKFLTFLIQKGFDAESKYISGVLFKCRNSLLFVAEPVNLLVFTGLLKSHSYLQFVHLRSILFSDSNNQISSSTRGVQHWDAKSVKSNY
ncbi:hypothetical protein HanIR_Chr10g0453031 [Helianthus annuus]|nr:hypothetical protein HanIR_Chr10g0453031 [Helianthus annuus]